MEIYLKSPAVPDGLLETETKNMDVYFDTQNWLYNWRRVLFADFYCDDMPIWKEVGNPLEV